MIKQEELRIGNLVEEPKGSTHKVERISEIDNRERYPIPLTEKWLLRLGFKKKKLDVYYWFELNSHKEWKFITNDSFYNGGKDKWHIGFRYFYDNDPIFLKTCNSVHAFQNLFFTLTGKNIKIKPTI